MRIFRIPLPARLFYPGAIFRLRARRAATVYLTFDDGPSPGVTGRVIDILLSEGVRATFFVTGEAAESHPELISRIKESGFSLANHGYHHIKGWRTTCTDYIRNTDKGAVISGSKLFRPPFGSITPGQFRRLRKIYTIVFWDLILYDFDPSFPRKKIFEKLKRRIRGGSVIVLHDNEKSSSPLILEELIRSVKELGYNFGDLAEDAGSPF
jgi:peptidoglycan/xylan/chitin deacetylase (PgdA/CDA1 family)